MVFYLACRCKPFKHLAQTLTLSPVFGLVVCCKLGYLLLVTVGLYLPRSLTRRVTFIEPLPHISHFLAIDLQKLRFELRLATSTRLNHFFDFDKTR